MGYKTTRSQIVPPSGEQLNFLRLLARWQGVATTKELHHHAGTLDPGSVRQSCKRRGWVTFDGSYWRMTDIGRTKLRAAHAEADSRADR